MQSGSGGDRDPARPGASHEIGGQSPARKFGPPDIGLFHSALPGHRGKTGALRGSSSPICNILVQISSWYSLKGCSPPSYYNAPSKNPQPSESCPPPAGGPVPRLPPGKEGLKDPGGLRPGNTRARIEHNRKQQPGLQRAGSFHPPRGMQPLWGMSASLRAGMAVRGASLPQGQ